MKKGKIFLIIGIIIVLLIIGYKGIIYYRYTFPKPDEVKSVVEGFKNRKTIKIIKQSLSNEEYITVGSFKMKNIINGYTLDENDSNKYLTYSKVDSDTTYKTIISKDNTEVKMVEAFLDNEIIIYNDGFFKGSITDADRRGFLKKNNIKNDIDFYKYVGNNYFINSNIFTNTHTLKQNYAFNLFTSTAVPTIDSWIILEGDINGYIFNVGTTSKLPVHQIYILDNNKEYSILTNDPNLKEEADLIDFISSIEIVK